MSADDGERGLMPQIGDLSSARLALELARISNRPGRDGDVPDIDDSEVLGVIAALANLSAVFARVIIRQQRLHNGVEGLDADGLLAAYLHDQEVRAAREELADFDGGFPW